MKVNDGWHRSQNIALGHWSAQMLCWYFGHSAEEFSKWFSISREKKIVFSYLHLDNYLYLKGSICKTFMSAAFLKLIAEKEIILAA